MQVWIAGLAQDEGDPLALEVVVRHPDARHVGAILDLDAAGEGFVLLGSNGQQYTYQVSARTRFISWRGDIQGLEDLQVGMWAAVAADQDLDGTFQARAT